MYLGDPSLVPPLFPPENTFFAITPLRVPFSFSAPVAANNNRSYGSFK